ncbi:hypothetical protein DFH06DRAFT_991055 [Mycena polygramma]|nr:hypothetical protein DFH06DRAFT_1004391 [Mycena polygramma]KAJ7657395.1 hypothetical protein DFH06DRAFT_991055 [Mycena polygramma]
MDTPSNDAASSGDVHASSVYGDRNESGLYDAVATQIEAMAKDALANVDYPDDFTRRVEEWSKNHRYLDREGNELHTAIVGEILGPAMGTIIRANGNYFAREGDDFKPIDDKAKVKDSIAIGIPTQCTTKLRNTFLNQVIALGQVTDATADEDLRLGRTPIIKNWTKPGKEGSENHDVISVSMLPKYAVPTAAGAPKAKRTAKRKLDEVDDDSGPSAKAAEAGDEPADIKLGAHYEPSLLPDYGGSYFNHNKAKLVQQDVRDIKNNLIPPWKLYDALRPGTLILILVSLHCFSMNDDTTKEIKRRVYQLNAHSIRVLSESDEPVEERTKPIAPNSSDRVTADLPARAKGSFASFTVPTVASPSASANGDDDMVGVEGSGKRKGKRTRHT